MKKFTLKKPDVFIIVLDQNYLLSQCSYNTTMESATLLCTEGFGLRVPMYRHNENSSKDPIGKGAHEPKAPEVQASPVAFFP